MQSADLARPVIQVHSFLTGDLQYEIYSFGEQIVVVPMHEVGNLEDAKITEYAQDAVDKKLAGLLPCNFVAKLKGAHDVNVYIPREYKPTVIGRAGKNIMELEKELGLKIHVSTFDELPFIDIEVDVRNSTKKQKMSIQFPMQMAEKKV
jgi:ATPase